MFEQTNKNNTTFKSWTRKL